jgi:hypothetical protein
MVRIGRLVTCPTWCTVAHARGSWEGEVVHLSGALMVRRTVLRLCAGHDPATGAATRPWVLVGDEEYSLHEADALVDALTQLVDLGSGSALAEEAEGALAVLHAELAQDAGHVDAHGGG